MQTWDVHPAATVFPAMDEATFASFKADVAARGQQEPIKLCDGLILDGRHRYRACRELGLTPKVEEWQGDDPVAYVVSTNLHRRHLTESQRALVAARLANLVEGAPRGNKNASKAERKTTASIEAVVFQPSISEHQAAEMLNVGRSSLQRAKRVLRDAVPEVVAMVEHKQVSVNAADEVSSMPQEAQRQLAGQGAKALRKAAARKRQEKQNGKRRGMRAGKHFINEAEASDVLTRAQALLDSIQSAGGLQALVRDWETNKRWQFSETLESLSKTLMRWAMETRHIR